MLSRAVLVTTGTLLLLVATALPATAEPWGRVDCAESPTPACALGAGKTPEGSATHAHAPHRDTEQSTGAGGRAKGENGDHVVGGDPVRCSYVRSDYRPPAGSVGPVVFREPGGGGVLRVRPVISAPGRVAGVVPGSAPGSGGGWYVYRCARGGVRDAFFRAPVWLADGPTGTTSPVETAQQARNALVLMTPRIAASPAGVQLVNLPTWLWVDRAEWGPRSATAAVPGVAVTATAVPSRVVWSMGDGATVVCAGPGTPFRAGTDPRTGSPDCGHTYRESSAQEPQQVFVVTATVWWSVRWSGAGAGGVFPEMTTTSTVRLPVAESQALGTG